jgi:hypothetical protein
MRPRTIEELFRGKDCGTGLMAQRMGHMDAQLAAAKHLLQQMLKSHESAALCRCDLCQRARVWLREAPLDHDEASS